jgi:hypothetical protein
VRKRERDEVKLTCGSHRHVASMSSISLCKTTGWPKMNDFDCWMVTIPGFEV